MSNKAKPRVYNRAGELIPVQARHWYHLQASGDAEQKAIEVYVYGEIGGWGITASQLVRDLRALDDGVSPVIAAFNSVGGDLFDGLAIHNALARLGERCTGRVDALAASAASVAVCGAHRVVMASNSMLMIHNPYTWTSGDAEDFRRVADVLDQTLEAIIAAYKAKAPNIDDAELRRLVNAETWLTAAEAVELGLADEIGDGVKVQACLGESGVLNRYQNAPSDLRAQMEDPDSPEPDPEPAPAPVADSAKLALLITQSCTQAGISNLIEPLIASTRLADEASVQSAINHAKAVRDLCVAARLPDSTLEFVSAGLDENAVRAKLFAKLTGSGGFEIDNSLPLEGDKPIQSKARQPDPSGIYAARKNHSSSARSTGQ